MRGRSLEEERPLPGTDHGTAFVILNRSSTRGRRTLDSYRGLQESLQPGRMARVTHATSLAISGIRARSCLDLLQETSSILVKLNVLMMG